MTPTTIQLTSKESRRFAKRFLTKPRKPNARMLRAMKLHDETVLDNTLSK